MDFVAVIEVPCGEESHRIGFDKRLRAIPLDHDVMMVEAFSAFGATRPECIDAFEIVADHAYEDWVMGRRSMAGWLLSTLRMPRHPHHTHVNAVRRALETAAKKKTNKERFGRFLYDSDLEPEEKVDLAIKYAGPHSRAVMALFERNLDMKQRVRLMKTPKLPPVLAGIFALLAADTWEYTIPRADRLMIAWQGTAKLRGWLSNSEHTTLTRKDRIELAKSAPQDQQCWIARMSGDWLPDKLRLKFAKGCRSSDIILEHIVREGLLPGPQTYQLAKWWLADRYPGTPYASPRDAAAARRIIIMKKAPLTPAQRLALTKKYPTWEPMGRRSIAASLYRQRRGYGFNADQAAQLKKLGGL
jgi:hypothetical protein